MRLGTRAFTVIIVTHVPHCSLWVMDWCSGAMLAERANWFLGPSAINDKHLVFLMLHLLLSICQCHFCRRIQAYLKLEKMPFERLGHHFPAAFNKPKKGHRACSIDHDAGCGCNLWPEMRYEALWGRVAQVCRKASHVPQNQRFSA